MPRNFIIVLLLFFTACKGPEQVPVFKRVDNIRISNEVKGKEVLVNADAYFFNPNPMKMKLKQMDVEVSLEGKKIGNINHDLKTVVPANAEFKVPVDATFNLDQVGTLNGILGILGAKKFEVQYKGYVKGSFRGFPVKIPVDYKSEIRF